MVCKSQDVMRRVYGLTMNEGTNQRNGFNKVVLSHLMEVVQN